MTITVAVAALATATSFTSEPVQDLAGRAGLPAADRQTLHDNGLDRIPVATRDHVGLVDEVLDGLDGQGFDRARCGAAVVTHSLPLAEDTVDALVDRLGAALPGLAYPPVTLTGRPCSVVHLGVELAARRTTGTTLVLGVDLAPTLDERFFFGTAMGDAAVGMVVGGPPRIGEILACRSTWHVLAADGALSDPADIARFRAENPTAIRATITDALTAAGLTWAELSAIVPHTPYPQVWDVIAALCRYPRERILDGGLPRTGHLNSNDVVVHLLDALRAGRLRTGDVVALVSPGFGGTRGCTVLRIGGAA
jgi:3-oxoacyl-[acyl-carrier-protein] synthase-3